MDWPPHQCVNHAAQKLWDGADLAFNFWYLLFLTVF